LQGISSGITPGITGGDEAQRNPHPRRYGPEIPGPFGYRNPLPTNV